MSRFRSRPVEIEAEQFLPGDGVKHGDVVTLVGHDFFISFDSRGPYIMVKTTQGQFVSVGYGEWVIAEPDGRGHYPCASEIFEKWWEPVAEPPEEKR